MVEFLYPYSFLLLVFLILFIQKEMEYKLNPKIIANKQNVKFRKYLLGLGYIFLIIALARPVTDKKEINTNMNVKKVALALDISKSMLAQDVYPNRLTFAKHKMEQFIKKFNGEMAIMAFSNTAFLISPYTSDKNSLNYLLNNIDTTYITSSGTDFKNLINTAKKMGYTDLILFTDGGDIKNLNTDGLNLYTLLIGKKNSAIKLANGNLLTKNGKVVIVGVNKDLIKFSKFGEIAQNGDSDIQKLISQNFQKVKNNKKIVVYKELFIYPLSLALLFLFMGFFSLPKKGIKMVLPLFLLFGIQAKAGILDWYYLNQAKQAYNSGDFNKSSMLYSKIDNSQAKFNLADSLYKQKKYKEALEIYKSINDKKLKEKVLYNKGNCLANLKQIDEAIKSYENALKLNPNDKDAKYNLELLKKHKKQQQKKNKNKKNDKKQNSQKNKDSKSKQQNKKNENKKQDKKQKQSQKQNEKKKEQKKKQNLKQQQEKNNKKEENKKKEMVKPIQIKPTTNSNIFNKIKSQTLMVPLSKGESKNEW